MYFYVLLYYCHRANTQLQLNKYIYIYRTENMHFFLKVCNDIKLGGFNSGRTGLPAI
jgi:hypothetical protein